MMAVTLIHYPATSGRLYYERKRREGKTPKEALRCLKQRAAGPGLLPAPRRPARHNRSVRITYHPAADAVYIHFTSGPLTPGRATLQAPTPPGTSGFIALDWKDGRLVGIEILEPAPASATTLSMRLRSTAKRPPFDREPILPTPERSPALIR